MWSSFGFKDDESYASNSNLGPPPAMRQSCCPRAKTLHMPTSPRALGQAFPSEHLHHAWVPKS